MASPNIFYPQQNVSITYSGLLFSLPRKLILKHPTTPNSWSYHACWVRGATHSRRDALWDHGLRFLELSYWWRQKAGRCSLCPADKGGTGFDEHVQSLHWGRRIFLEMDGRDGCRTAQQFMPQCCLRRVKIENCVTIVVIGFQFKKCLFW